MRKLMIVLVFAALVAGTGYAHESTDQIHEAVIEPDGVSETNDETPPGFITTHNGHFFLNGTPWYPYGVYYFPLYAVNPDNFPSPTPDHWFHPDFYDSALIEDDLNTIRDLGMNMVGIGLPKGLKCGRNHNVDCVENVIHFLDQCHKRNLKVFLYIPFADISQSFYRPSDVLAVLTDERLGLSERTEVFAFDVAWEPNLGHEEKRARYNGAFSRWIAMTFGDAETASGALGFTLPDHGEGWQAAVISHNVPIVLEAGSAVPVEFKVRNMGTKSWGKENPVRWGTLYPNPDRNPITEDEVAPGESATISFVLTAPSTPGRVSYRFRMIQDENQGFGWFGEQIDIDVEVVEAETGIGTIQKKITLPQPILGPTDYQLSHEPPDDHLPPSGQWAAFVASYRRAVALKISRQFARVVRLIRTKAPQLISCRQGYGGNGAGFVVTRYPLDLASTAAHFDFLSPEGYALLSRPPDRNKVRRGMAVTNAYARWASAGKPVYWAEFGWNRLGQNGIPGQATHFNHFISAMLDVGSDGCTAWWWPGGKRSDENSDFGIINPNGTLRPVCNVISSLAEAATKPRILPAKEYVHVFNPSVGVRGYADIYDAAQNDAQAAIDSGRRFVMMPIGAGSTSNTDPIELIGNSGEATRDLIADLHLLELRVGDDGEWFEVTSGQYYAVAAHSPIWIRARVFNLGPATWISENVRFAANENYGSGFRWPIPDRVERMEELVVPEMVLTEGIGEETTYQFQMVAEHRVWINGSVRIHLVIR